ncbi:MAG: carbohydrate ABC transporter permease [Brachybacterium tyrofermentans]|uniref:carbohydrate ABC transporter permease n=1 Tax=Brachybacterium tyrofermentans TaxID=47848 RepID=UPI000A1B4F40|nr:N-Acetyl-D-glucosamine ABC transport system, permease protein 1 [Corynebacterium xerosis]
MSATLTTTPTQVPTSPGSTPERGRLHRPERFWGRIFIAPPVIGFALFALAPLLFSLYAAFTHWNGLSAPLFSGFSNISRMAGDPQFWQSLGNTLFLMLGVPIGLALSLALALALNRRMPGRAAFRVIYYLPGVSSVAAIAILWQWALNGDFGLVNQLLATVGIDGPNWLAEKMWVKPALIIMGVWKGIGFSTLLYLAALQSVPRTLLEAAMLDGAGALLRFRHVTLPMLSPVTFFLVVTGIIGGAQMFAEINIMTPTGGPEFGSATIVWYIWQQGFQNLQLGYATAMSLVLGLMIFLVTAIQFYLNSRNVFTVE